MLILWGAWLGFTRPLGARPGFSPAPKGVLPPRIRPEGADTRPEKTAITSQNHGFRARRAGEFHFSCVLCRSKGGVDAYAPEAAVLSLDVLGEGQAILPRIFQQELAELLLRNRRFQIILAPLGVGAVEIGGAFLGVGLEADIRRCLHELGQVVAVRHGCFKVLDGALADGELIAVRQQTVQTFQHPQQDAGSLLGQLFDEEGIIHPGRVTVFHRDEDLSTPETVAVIVSGHKVAIAEADETNVQQALDSLLVFPFDAQTVFGGDDGLDVPGFGQSHHVQVVIDHDQLVLQIGTGKAVRFDAEDGFGVRGFPEQLLQQQADAGFALAALAGNDQRCFCLRK